MKTTIIPQIPIFRVALGTAAILMIPLVAMQFTAEVNWTLSDFLVMGTMLFITGNLIDLAMTKLGKYRIVAAVIIIFFFLWLWAELAVGVFTNWGS